MPLMRGIFHVWSMVGIGKQFYTSAWREANIIMNGTVGVVAGECMRMKVNF
ncbi:hypothetical protein JCM19241_5348 [Vibrio ishigakensis]|uniref:Uncharacterized protein n=1 Tax=Vibrio ishigakensis TaxID=1481914 RepID=A0A0B8QB20_9VIBR|nr:hypothetical protein JCM19241_5348 [Vibrio ishigakensis]